MADLIGTATIRVSAATAEASQAIRRFTAQTDTRLRALQRRVTAATRDLGRLGDRTIAVRVDDRTAVGVASVTAAVRNLQRLDPVQISARFDAQTADITATTAAMRPLRTSSASAARALDNLREQAIQASMGLRTLITTAAIAGRHLDSLRDNTRQLRSEMQSLRTSVRLTGDGLRSIGDDGENATRRLGDLASAGGGAAASLGRSGGGLGAVLLGVGAVVGTSMLPAVGALVPMMGGAALAAGTLGVAFNGVGEAVAAAGEDQEKYAEALKKLSPPARAFAKELVAMKEEFAPFTKEIQKAALPGFTQALKDARPVMKLVGQAMTDMAEGFGDAAREVGRLMKDSGFQTVLQTNMKLGTQFVKDMTTAMGPFVKSLLDFGAASGPTLKAFSDGFGGLLTKGLPGFFQGLTPGIGGAAKALDGLFDAVNTVLPAFGRLSGEIAKTAGPLVGEALRALGFVGAGAMDALRGAVVLLSPIVKDLGYGLKTVIDFGRIIAPTMKDTALAIISGFSPVGSSIDKAVGPLQQLNRLVNDNKVGILETARVFGGAMIDMTGAAIAFAPKVAEAFKAVSIAVLSAVDGIVVGAEAAFGWIPGVGDKVKTAAAKFKEFKDGFIGNLDEAQRRGEDFAAQALPKLEQGKLLLNINNWQEQIATAKQQMKTVPPEKKATLKARIDDLQAKVRRAKEDLASVRSRSVEISVHYNYTPAKRSDGLTFMGASGRLARGGRVPRYASGGPVQAFPAGGQVEGPGTPTSDSVFAMLGSGARARVSDTEYVVRGAAVRKYGVGLFDALNAMQMPAPRLAGGGAAAGMAGRDVALGLVAGMGAATRSVEAAARAMATAVLDGVRGELQISSPSRAMKAVAKDVGKGFISGLTASRDKIKAVSKDLASDVRAAFSGRRESALIKVINRDTNRLLSLAKQRDSIAKRLADANKFATDTASKARATGNLAGIVQQDAFSPAFVRQQMRASLNDIKTFTANVQKLQKQGLNKDLLRQILEMGPEQGAQFAKALANTDKATIKQYNSLNTQIGSASSKLGKVGADLLYDSGKKAGAGFLTGLKAQQKEIEKLMLSIAKGMQKALRKALGIKSPARALIPDGINTARGIAVGVVRGLPHIDDAMRRVAGSVTAGVPSAASVPQLASMAAGRRTAQGITVNYTVHVTNNGMISSQRELESWFVRTLDNTGRTNRLPVSVIQAVRRAR